jgi:hypothetical protein
MRVKFCNHLNSLVGLTVLFGISHCLLVPEYIKYLFAIDATTLWNLNTSYSFGGRKFEHALKHGSKIGLFVVTLGWFVDSVRRNGKS